MAEAKLAAIRALMGQYYDALELEPHILDILNSQEVGGYWQGDVYGRKVADGLREYALRRVAEDLAALPPDHDVYNPGVPLDHKEP
jgi:hypothetical protein